MILSLEPASELPEGLSDSDWAWDGPENVNFGKFSGAADAVGQGQQFENHCSPFYSSSLSQSPHL